MSRSAILSNGELCVTLDERGLVRDVYYPHVGLENHIRTGDMHHVGVWVDGVFSWMGEDTTWQITVTNNTDSLVSNVKAVHNGLQIQLEFQDIVYNEANVFLRTIIVTNLGDTKKDVRIFLGTQFQIYKSMGGETAYFDPTEHALIHYKGRRVFLAYAIINGEPFQDYAAGIAGANGQDGAYRDAEDGTLSKNPIEHGQVDSVMGLAMALEAQGEGRAATIHTWIVAATSIKDVTDLHHMVLAKTPTHILHTTTKYWHAWTESNMLDFKTLSPDHIRLFKQSLLYVRAHVDRDGGILASLDSDMLQHGFDTYAYIWPRDSAYAALALDAAGDSNVAKRFFAFCSSVMSDDGYMMHKYLPDGSLGSSWHPWIKNGENQLPIQEDETATVIYALYQHYLKSRDIEFLELLYKPFIEPAADFMRAYRDTETKLPLASYDLWEEKRGVSTYTSASVYGGLIAAAEISKILGKDEHESHYRSAAQEVKTGILEHLWDENRGIFIKQISQSGGVWIKDTIVDSSSAYGVFLYGVLLVDDPRLESAWENTVQILSSKLVGGLIRYEGDQYFRSASQSNPWIITTLWHVEYLVASMKSDDDMVHVRQVLDWCVKYAQTSGVLSEQLDPVIGAPLSATPLCWSHAQYVRVVLAYEEKLKQLREISVIK